MRYGISLVALLSVLSVSAAPLNAQGRGNGHAKKAVPTATTKAKPVKAPKVEGDRAPKIKADKAPKVKKLAGTPTTPVTPKAPVTPTTPTTRTVKNPRLESRLLALLPPGSTIQDASQGFKNWGQFVAAAHVSNNLNIPFADLKARMTGLVPGTVPGTFVQTTPMSLGQAIQSFKRVTTETPKTATFTPTKIKNEVKKAEDAASADLRRTRDNN